MGIDRQLQLDQGMRFVDLQLRFGHRIVYPVVDIKRRGILIIHPVAPHIAFIRQDQCGGHWAYRHAGAFIVVADGGNNNGDLLRGKAQVIQNTERHHGAALAVVHPVHQVSDIVQIPCDFGKLHRALRVSQRLQDITRFFRHERYMGKAVLGIAQRHQRSVRLPDIGINRFVHFDFFVSHSVPPFGKVIVKSEPFPGVLCTLIWA